MMHITDEAVKRTSAQRLPVLWSHSWPPPCDEVYRKAVAAGASVIEEPTDMPYGQRRMLLRDPDGTVLDVSAPTAPIA